jgi:hypothetical protein
MGDTGDGLGGLEYGSKGKGGVIMVSKELLDGIKALHNKMLAMMEEVGTNHNVMLAHNALCLAWCALEGNENMIERDLKIVIEAAEGWRESQMVKVSEGHGDCTCIGGFIDEYEVIENGWKG